MSLLDWPTFSGVLPVSPAPRPPDLVPAEYSQVRLWLRIVRHPRLHPYNRLAVAVLMVNLAVLLAGPSVSAIADLLLANMAVAVLIRQRFVVNSLFFLVLLIPRTWPLRLRHAAAKIYHVGGLHVGATVAATGWFVLLTVDTATHRAGRPNPAVLAVQFLGCAVLGVLLVFALPVLRRRKHNLFERTHRFGGWLLLALFWVYTVLSEQTGPKHWYANLLGSPRVWVLVLITLSVASSWLTLRRVAVTASRPSNHLVVLRLHDRRPNNGSTTAISRRPWLEWHGFATISTPGQPGYRIIVSRAGDWTARLIDRPPRSVWVKGGPVYGVGRVEALFNRMLFVATGSGIGPTLASMTGRRLPFGILWITRRPDTVFGRELVEEIRRLCPDAIIVDTAVTGKPDVVALTYQMARRINAEAVICVANEKVTRQVTYGMEQRGLPAFGAIWDS